MKILYRSKNNRILGGVCAGLGEHLDVDPTVIRLIWAVVSVLHRDRYYHLYPGMDHHS
jgi:phage shock protein PspC (stress-responsive transcriptional regulator)